MANTKKEKSFEQQLKRLEEIVSLLEKGDADLDESLGLFEEGAGLIQSCNTILENAEQRVKQLNPQAPGQAEEENFE